MTIKKYQYKRLAFVLVVFLCLFVVALVAVARVRTIVRNQQTLIKVSNVASADAIIDHKLERNQIEPAINYQPAPPGGPPSSPLPTFVAQGFRAGFENASSNRNGPIQAVSVTAVNRGNERLEALDVLLLDFTPQATISRIERKVLPVNATPNGRQSLYFESALPRDLGHAQVLAITGITSEKKRQDLDLKALTKALAKQQGGGPPAAAVVAEKGKSEFSPTPCFSWFQLTHDVAGDNKSGVSGFTCNQSEQSFAVILTAPR